MTHALQQLIREARTELGSEACRAGKHQWESIGGRSCPKDLDDCCSQAVYHCYACGQDDYGDTGGPGAADCLKYCHYKGR